MIFDVLPRDRSVFLSLLAYVVAEYRWICHAYCLMGNHFHLVLETPEANISGGMQYLKGEYAAWFNAVHPDRVGVLFERRFWSRIATTERHVAELARYVVLNPVRAGLVRVPEAWEWSSYAATVGLRSRPPFLHCDGVLALFGGSRHGPVTFAQFVGEGLADPARAVMAIRAMDGSDPFRS